VAAAVSGGGPPPHGRYYAELVPTFPETGLQATVQELLDAGERKEWHLVGVAGGLPEGACSSFGITRIPALGGASFGRTGAMRLATPNGAELPPPLYFSYSPRPSQSDLAQLVGFRDTRRGALLSGSPYG
jgi:hypothetical protein